VLWKRLNHWSEIRLDNASIVYKSEAGSHRPPPDSGAPLLYRFVLQTVVFRVFCLDYVSDRGNFTITTIEAYKKNFEQNIWSIMAFNAAKRDLQKSTQNIQELLLLDEYSHEIWEMKQPHCERKRTEVRLCLSTRARLLLSYKINLKYTRIYSVTGRIFSGNLKKWSS
jgi:hypothetical protein